MDLLYLIFFFLNISKNNFDYGRTLYEMVSVYNFLWEAQSSLSEWKAHIYQVMPQTRSPNEFCDSLRGVLHGGNRGDILMDDFNAQLGNDKSCLESTIDCQGNGQISVHWFFVGNKILLSAKFSSLSDLYVDAWR